MAGVFRRDFKGLESVPGETDEDKKHFSVPCRESESNSWI